MIEAVIFELGAALLQLDAIAGLAYGQAAAELRPGADPAAVVARSAQLLGLPRQEIALQLLREFELQPAATHASPKPAGHTGWQLLLRHQARAYARLIVAPDVIQATAWQHSARLIYTARSMGCRVALVSDTTTDVTRVILEVLALSDSFDLVLAGEDVQTGLADPELYHSVAREFALEPASCLAVCRTPLGVRAALCAGSVVLAVAPPQGRHAFEPYESHARCVIVSQPTALPGHLRAEIIARQPAAWGADEALPNWP
jgi:beta-phosphoglucomutase-like phosphatase (HAD superfamily)